MAFKVKIRINTLILFLNQLHFTWGINYEGDPMRKKGPLLQATFSYERIEGPYEGKLKLTSEFKPGTHKDCFPILKE